MAAPKAPDVSGVHAPRLPRVDGLHGHAARWAEREMASGAIGGGDSKMGQLAAGQRAVAVYTLDHLALPRQILVAPQPHSRKRTDVAPRVHHHVLGADHAPAAFGLDLAHRGRRPRRPVAGAVAVGDLVEAVLCGHRADAHRLEQHVVARIPCHRRPRQSRRQESAPGMRREETMPANVSSQSRRHAGRALQWLNGNPGAASSPERISTNGFSSHIVTLP